MLIEQQIKTSATEVESRNCCVQSPVKTGECDCKASPPTPQMPMPTTPIGPVTPRQMPRTPSNLPATPRQVPGTPRVPPAATPAPGTPKACSCQQ
eukprot:6039004-Amphidinium_carterae.1